MEERRLWVALAIVLMGSFAVLGFFGREIYQEAPPIPERVVSESGRVLFTGQDIRDGQNVWQSTGGQQLGSIWGHGSYVAPDWSADWLHREGEILLEVRARQQIGREPDQLTAGERASVAAEMQGKLRANRYDAVVGDLVVSDERAEAIARVSSHYDALFGDDPRLDELRDAYAMPPNVVPDPIRRRKLNAFFFWTAWACVTERPGETISYTHNWPPDELVGNRPPSSLLIWTGVSVVLLIAGIGALAWYFAARRHPEEEMDDVPSSDPLLGLRPTPSMRATLKYFWVATALFVVQIGLGAVTAHYAVEGSGFYGIPLAQWLPYAVVRTWHVQLGIFWIATAWLATGLYLVPAVSGYEAPHQRVGVNALFAALLVIVGGSLFGTWYGTRQRMDDTFNFWFGHQGLEYIDIGRFWQVFLFIGLFLWLGLMVRGLIPALRKRSENRPLLLLFLIASGAIALFYGAGLVWGQQSHLAIIEYWRWWVVHLWVEGFFEVFATVAIAFLFTRMRLLRVRAATLAVLFSTVIFLSGGIIGTFHHLYFTGTPTSVLALGSVFSALEVVPLTLIGFEAYGNLTMSRARPWTVAYRLPIYFFVAVAFWNLVGAGIFGFLINPPIALYYMQGLNTTPVHAHTALFGVYGMLGIGLMLFCLRGLTVRRKWRTGVLSASFWAINVGLGLMVLISVLPVGVLQTLASFEHGMWYARSAEFLQSPLVAQLRWLRVIGDTIFALGAVGVGWFVVGLKTGWSIHADEPDEVSKVEGGEGEVPDAGRP